MVSRSSVGQHNSREANALRNQRLQRSSWFLRRLLLDGHNCQRQDILVFQQASSFLRESFAGVEDTNSFLFLSQEWHRTCKKVFTEEALKLRMSNIHFYPFKETKSLLEEEKGFVDAGLDLLQRTTSSPRNCLFFYQSYMLQHQEEGGTDISE